MRSAIAILFAIIAVASAQYTGNLLISGSCPTNNQYPVAATNYIAGYFATVPVCTVTGTTSSTKIVPGSGTLLATLQTFAASTTCQGASTNNTAFTTCSQQTGYYTVSNAYIDAVNTAIFAAGSNFATVSKFGANNNCGGNATSVGFVRLGLGVSNCISNFITGDNSTYISTATNAVSCSSTLLSVNTYSAAGCATTPTAVTTALGCTSALGVRATCNAVSNNSTAAPTQAPSSGAATIVTSFAIVFAIVAALF